ncbi:helix-turn-helix transcriptional regulator [Pedobacter sp. AW1-32]|uniref:helix-turn-helix transcriptional regulator n=1 Tax=Pedobacter sp. AW1-32 TaxID=3383026 RepID=UPI003FEEC854
MALSIFDNQNQQYIVNSFCDAEISQPLVTERREKFSFPFGDAEIIQIAFSGIFIIYGDVIVREKRLRVKSFDEPDLVELHFSLTGGGTMENFLTNKTHCIKPNHHLIVYTPDFDGIADFQTNNNCKFFEVHFQRDKFIDLTCESSILLKKFADEVAASKAVEISEESLPISLAMYTCIQDIMNCKVTGGLKLLFLQSKCLELLALQAEAFELAHQKEEKQCLRSGYDKDRIEFAKDYLIEHAAEPPSLMELAKLAGINEFKLKQGFKETFQNTVFGYLSDYKMMKAKELLLEGAKDIKNISDELGYSSVQHFSTAFNKKFGISPGKVRKA